MRKQNKDILNKLAESPDEPYFVFRAKDKLSLDVLRYYHNLCVSSNCDTKQMESVSDWIHEFEVWQKHNVTKIPDFK